MSMLILLDGTQRRGIRQSHTTTAVLPDDGDAVFFWRPVVRCLVVASLS
jgi:hypothetical protein